MAPLSLPSIDEIRKLRKKLGLTQSQLAELSDVSQSLISQIESGEVDPRLSTLNRIVEALNSEESDREVFAEDIYVRDLIWVSPDDTVMSAANAMWTHAISQLPVIDNGRNLGSISEKSITGEIAKGSAANLGEKRIRDVMQDPFPMVSKRTRMEAILSLLQESPAVLVIADGRIGGIITKADVLTRLRKGKISGSDGQVPACNSSK